MTNSAKTNALWAAAVGAVVALIIVLGLSIHNDATKRLAHEQRQRLAERNAKIKWCNDVQSSIQQCLKLADDTIYNDKAMYWQRRAEFLYQWYKDNGCWDVTDLDDY